MNPAISTAFDADTEEFVIMATSYGRSAVAGPRILRAPPHPDIAYRHKTEDGANRDAAKLRAYFEGLGKGPSKAKLRAAGE